MSQDLSEGFELSKENVLPILKGRKCTALRTALHPASEEDFSKQQHAFEQELRTYDGDDPLSVWVKYITWIEQHFLKGGTKSNLDKLIQSCLANLGNDDMYHNDERYVEILLKFAATTKDPLEVYNNMHVRKVGTTVAKFYIVWSWELEQVGNLSKAVEVLNTGIHQKAEPLEDIKLAQTQLEMRLAKNFASLDLGEDTGLVSRFALTSLNPTSSNRAPILRVGDATRSSEQGNSFASARRNQPRLLPFKIHNSEIESHWVPHECNDTNSSVHLLSMENAKENDRKPGKWNKTKLKSRTKTPKMQFEVHFDETLSPEESPFFLKMSENPRVLSCHKKMTAPTRFPVFQQSDNLNEKNMFDEFKVYGGAEEFSFEEIRAADYWKKIKLVVDLKKENKTWEKDVDEN